MHNLEIKNAVQIEAFKKFLLELSNDTQLMFNYFGTISENTIDEIVKKEITRNDKLKFFSFLDDVLIGYSFLTLFDKPSKKHNCILGIVLGDNWQRMGFGEKMCKEMIKKAWNLGLKKIWLTVHFDNRNAIKLYKKLGFMIEGIFMNDELIDGKFRNIVSMALLKDMNFTFNDRIKICNEIEKS